MKELKSHPSLIQIYASRLKLENRNDGKYWSQCPFHDDRNPSFNIGVDDNREWVASCFGCGWGGDCVKFVKDFDKISFKEATKIIEEVTGGDWEQNKIIVDKTFKPIEFVKTEAQTYSLEEYYKLEVAFKNSPEAQEWLFTERGITIDAALKARVGFCQKFDQAKNMGESDSELLDLWDKGWITFPYIKDDRVTCIKYRSIIKKKNIVKKGMRVHTLFGLDNISSSEPIYVVEGECDQIIMAQAGYKAVAISSASVNVTPEMRDCIMSASLVILAGDNDNSVGTAKMIKLWKEFGEKTYRLVWGYDQKDANQVFLEEAKRDISSFRKIVDALTLSAYSNPIPGVQSLQDILVNDESETASEHPDRFRFPWPSVDSMTNILPGSVVYVSATDTGTGKTQWVMQSTLNAARNHNEVVLNYQTQLQGEEIGEIVTANILAKDRNNISKEDRLIAAKRLRGVQYYIGNDPNISRMNDVLDLIEAGVRRVGATVCVLDLIHSVCMFEKDDIKAQEQCINRIKKMAQKYLLKFFVVGQPRKQESKNQGKPLSIYDSKGSEAIPSESDAIFYLHRDTNKNMTEDTEDRLSPELQVRLMKGRRKGKGAAFTKLFFLGKIATFNEIEKYVEIPIDNRFDF